MATEPKSVVLTGATSGVGRGAAISMARLGVRLVLLCRDADRALACTAAVRAAATGPAPEIVVCDLADRGSVELAAAAVLALCPRIDALVHCAGITTWVLWTFHLARRLEGTGVTANTFCPGFVHSGLTRRFPLWLRPLVGAAHVFAQSEAARQRCPWRWTPSSPGCRGGSTARVWNGRPGRAPATSTCRIASLGSWSPGARPRARGRA
ncbi:MAG: NAD(P)-dependent dehydrogenase (short-subunit alcohol dehydrogenase family) [Myxococcota bacterium]|jgi:NAD(P)-dependent dehydrogenase (short-subunit alcohol dehydrogenase family)